MLQLYYMRSVSPYHFLIMVLIFALYAGYGQRTLLLSRQVTQYRCCNKYTNCVKQSQLTLSISLNRDFANCMHSTTMFFNALFLFYLKLSLEECSYIKFTIEVDVLAMVTINSSISSLKRLFVRGIKDQLQGIVSCFDSFSEVKLD